jgi:hypothetical protein
MRCFVRSLILCCLVAVTTTHAQSVADACRGKGFGNDSVGCATDRPCIKDVWTDGGTLRMKWTATEDFDHYNVRWSRPGKPEVQSEVSGGRDGSFQVTNDNSCTSYDLKVQGCQKPLIGSSTCTAWEETVFKTPPDHRSGLDSCAPGFVWRDAFPGDHVCVNLPVRDQAATDNAQAGSRRSPNGGDSGPDTCRAGFVWREARPTDHVCVSLAVREQAQRDNAAKCSRLVSCP